MVGAEDEWRGRILVLAQLRSDAELLELLGLHFEGLECCVDGVGVDGVGDLELIGRGGSSDVYRAADRSGEPVAVVEAETGVCQMRDDRGPATSGYRVAALARPFKRQAPVDDAPA